MFVGAVFAGPLRALGIALVAPRPRPGGEVVAGYRAALDAALAACPDPGALLVGGISLGAHVAAQWAARRGRGIGGVLLALPAWTGPPAGAPASAAARASAALVRATGVESAVVAAAAGASPWLAAELTRAWRRHGDTLAAALEVAAAEPGPDQAALQSLAVPAGIAAVRDDPVHPVEEARRWQRLLPRAVLHTTTLAAFGADPEVVGRAAVLGWLRAAHRR